MAKAKYSLPKKAYRKTASSVASKLPWRSILATGLAGGTVVGGTAMYMSGKKGRKQMAGEVRDPRLYSNLRGMVTGESRKKRVAAHKELGKGKGTVLSAMGTGFGRKGEKTASIAAFADEFEKIAISRKLISEVMARHAEKAGVQKGLGGKAFFGEGAARRSLTANPDKQGPIRSALSGMDRKGQINLNRDQIKAWREQVARRKAGQSILRSKFYSQGSQAFSKPAQNPGWTGDTLGMGKLPRLGVVQPAS